MTDGGGDGGGDDDMMIGGPTFSQLICNLASCQYDCLTATKRNEMIDMISKSFEITSDRHTFASLEGIPCDTKYGCSRMANLYCTAILLEKKKMKDDENENDSNKDITSKLCHGLCQIIYKSGDSKLLDKCQKKLFGNSVDDDLAEIFSKIASGSTTTNNESMMILVASAMVPTKNWQVFIDQSLLKDPIASSNDMKLCQSMLQTSMDVDSWENIIAPSLVLKLKAKPESVCDMVEGLTKYVNPNAIATSAVVVDGMLPVLSKHLKSPKEIIRLPTASILQHLATATIKSMTTTTADDGGDAAKKTLKKIIKTTAETKPLAQVPQREAFYTTLRGIGKDMVSDRIEIDAATVSTVLSSICAPLAKEAKTAAEAREKGLEALLYWMVIGKRNGGNKGYDEALNFIRKPIIAKTGSEASNVLGSMVRCLHPDLIESLTLDLWKDSKFVKGLEGLVEVATKKHEKSSSSIPQVEGILAVYLALVYVQSSSSNKLSTVFDKVLAAGSSTIEKTSFVYGDAVAKAVPSNKLIAKILPQIIVMYTKFCSTKNSSSSMAKPKASSALTRAVACCITHPTQLGKLNPVDGIESTIQSILDYQPIADALVEALFEHANQISLDAESLSKSLNVTRQSREEMKTVSIKGKCSPTSSHRGMDVSSVRRVARKLSSRKLKPKSFGMVLILMHIGTSLRIDGNQRNALVGSTTTAIQDGLQTHGTDEKTMKDLSTMLVELIAENASQSYIPSSSSSKADDDGKKMISEGIHLGTLSLIISLGSVGATFSPDADDPEDEDMKPHAFANRLCITSLAPMLATSMKVLVSQVESLSQSEIDVYKSPMGSLYRPKESMTGGAGGGGDGQKKISGKGRMTEDEEWELQMKQELAKKKKAQQSGSGGASVAPSLTAEEKKVVTEQDVERKRVMLLIETCVRSLASIECLAQSDIEIGNACLPIVSEGIITLAVSISPALSSIHHMKQKSFNTLTTLATCVYEISEEYSSMIAMALVTSYRKKMTSSTDVSDGPPRKDSTATAGTTTTNLTVSALPSPCEPAATTIFEMDEFHGELSGNSFVFLFPVLHASLMGPRTTPGCEGALRVLERHTILLAGDERDPTVTPLRADMVASVLELLKHDRAQTFVDPSPYDTLVACYQAEVGDTESGPVLSTAELAALLDERGALGGKSCRIASMIALGSIASSHRKIVKNNPLIENRIWMNCFDKNQSIRTEARRTWGIVHDKPGLEEEETTDGKSLPAPSPMYAIPLLALLNHDDKAIAAAASSGFACGMAVHPNSVNRNIKKLCSTYIDSCPQPGSGDAGPPSGGGGNFPSPAGTATATKATPKPISAAAPKKTNKLAGLKKKTTKKPSALQVAGIGQPKKTKKKATHSALLKPKTERTLDQATLESQFKTGPQKAPPEKDTPEKVSARLGVLAAIASLTSFDVVIELSTLKLLTSFMMAYAIADADEGVKNTSRNALRDIVATYGGSDDAISFLLPHLDGILKTGVAEKDGLDDLQTGKIPEGTTASDRRKEGAVVALGSVALHLKGPENASKIDTTVDMLLNSLKTPNEDVQSSVADCLAKLMKKGNTQQKIETILDDLVQNCLDNETVEGRRGAAYGIAAAVKGSGIAALKKYSIVSRLEEACDEGNSSSKEGALFAIELLCTRLGLLFEPYVISLLPSLLRSFSDSNDRVRKAASRAVGLIMSKLSAHGVKLVMPAVLTAFNDSAWRTKQASIHMLGSMCHLAPKQLASALPKVVPKLIEAFADTHPKVKGSAQEALDEISTVIRNPEISSISPVLLKALTDPADHTQPALEALIETEFLHAIDAPSLALIVPILHRGLRDRAATTKRFGALITGNICTMINDPRDFRPYLTTLIPDLKTILLDPIPDVRSISAKAFGSLTRGLGEDSLLDLRPWLLETLRSEDISSAERSGAAQGLTEVLIASGTTAVETVVLDELLPLKNHPSPSTREGVLWILTFLPPALGQGFTSLLDSCLPVLISGLSDENETVRDIGMRAGRVIIKSHGRVHFKKILPILQDGMSDIDYRIRLSSLMLTGDLLSMIGGTTVIRTDGDTQDDLRKAEKAQAQLTLALGMETRNLVLSDIYIARSDSAVAVRQTAVQVWKTVVSVTARTLRQILPVLVNRIVSDLASGDVEKTEMAGKCLGDIVSKLGDSVFPEIIPVLRSSLYSGDTFTRRGVCVGLSEVIGSSTREQIVRYIEIIVKVVQDALCDDDEGVREMAANGFQNLYNLVGSRAMEEILPSLMVALEISGADETKLTRSLNGLTGILSIRSRELLTYIMPRLIQEPITLNHAKALSSISTVTGDAMYLHFTSVIPALMNDLASSSPGDDDDEKERIDAVRDSVKSIFGNSEEAGVNRLVVEVSSKCTSDKAELRKESCWMLETIVVERKDQGDFYEQIPIMIRELVHRFNDENTTVLKAAHSAFAALSKHVSAEELVKHVEFMRNLIASMVSDARRRKGGVGDGEFLLPGFNIPKGLEPLLPIYQRGILYGTPSIREASAAGLGEVISLTSTKYLAGPLIIKMTGPLLRIVGDRNPSNVKIAILKTLGLILVKGGPALRAFVPQFQTTFVKALADPSRQVRLEAIKSLGLLMPLSTRVDPLLKELVAGSLGKNAATTDSVGIVAVQSATLDALAVALEKGGKKAKLPDSVPSALNASKELVGHSDEAVRESAAKAMGSACQILGIETTTELIEEDILDDSDDDSADIRHGKACAIRRIFSVAVSKDLDTSISAQMLDRALEYMKDDKGSVKDAGCVAVGAAVGRSEDPASSLRRVEPELLQLMRNSKERMETHQSIARGLSLALQLADVEDRVDYFGLELLNGCLKLALSGAQRIQFAFNDVLYLALEVGEGQEGLDRYSSLAMFDDSKQMKSVYTKVLLKIKEVTILND